MAFPRRLLHEGEDVVLDLRPHWSFVARPALALLAGLATAIWMQARISSGERYKDVVLIPVLVLVVLVLGWFVGRYARWATRNLVVTTERVVIRSGVVVRRGREVPLGEVRDVTEVRSLLGRVWGVGTLVVESSAGDREVFASCARPARVRSQILDQVGARARTLGPDHRAGLEVTPLAQLEKLEELRRRGVISQAEFDSTKAQLLDRL